MSAPSVSVKWTGLGIDDDARRRFPSGTSSSKRWRRNGSGLGEEERTVDARNDDWHRLADSRR